jgi:tetratricopeptide (TPR) repeat protein
MPAKGYETATEGGRIHYRHIRRRLRRYQHDPAGTDLQRPDSLAPESGTTDHERRGVGDKNLQAAAVDLYNKALESVKAGERDKAIEQLKGAIAIFPEFVAALNGLGGPVHEIGNYQFAFEAFNSALSISPDSSFFISTAA